jgi:hypothetical protein
VAVWQEISGTNVGIRVVGEDEDEGESERVRKKKREENTGVESGG